MTHKWKIAGEITYQTSIFIEAQVAGTNTRKFNASIILRLQHHAFKITNQQL